MNEFGIQTINYYKNKSLLKTVQELLKIKADVYHITGDVHYLALFLPRRKTTITIHDIGHYKNNKGSLKFYIFALLWFILPIAWVKKITVISELTKNDLIRYFKINPYKIEVIENPITQTLIPVYKEFNIQETSILQIGTGWHKNLIGLIEAIKGLNCKIEIIGNPSTELRQKIEDYHIEYNIETNVSNERICEKYEECDILYFASFIEGFGLPIIEAQTIGRPVITSNISPTKEVAGDAAILVNPHSSQEIRTAILLLIHDGILRNGLIEKGFENIKRFLPNKICNDYYQFYKTFFSVK
jgi:glycosyltransferase involved in cell wall biosynthesis